MCLFLVALICWCPFVEVYEQLCQALALSEYFSWSVLQLILTSCLCTFDGLKLLEKSKAAKWEADVFLQKNVSPKGSLWSWKKNICNALWWKKFWFIKLSKIFKIYEKGFICSKCEMWEFASNRTSRNVSYIPCILELYEWNTLMESTLDPKDWR